MIGGQGRGRRITLLPKVLSRTGAPTCTNTREKAARALYIMIRHFGITTKRTAAPRPPRHEFYIWKRVHARKPGPSLSLSFFLSLPRKSGPETRYLDFHPVTQRKGTIREFQLDRGQLSLRRIRTEFHQPVFTRGNS